MKKSTTYRIRRWSEYYASLKKRGGLTIWVSPEAGVNWTIDELTREPDISSTYTDLAIEAKTTVQTFTVYPDVRPKTPSNHFIL
jgi:hypothetical protein